MTQKVLLIEDDTYMLTLLRTFLRLEGFDVAAVEYDTDLESVMATVRAEQPALILMDVNLRQISGIDLLKAIRQDKQTQATQIIMASGVDVREYCLEHGANAFILKPYMPEELVQQIRRMLPEEH